MSKPHPLKDYLDRNKIGYAEFARRIAASNAGVVYKYATGQRQPRPRFMKAIVRETDGAVTANDFLVAAD